MSEANPATLTEARAHLGDRSTYQFDRDDIVWFMAEFADRLVAAERERYAQLVEAAERAVVLLADCGTPKSRHGLMAALADLGEDQ